jgi:acetoin:2,6-dichlorophenolindophenol oxidoreductase subunit beta
MARMTFVQAVRDALAEEMRLDARTFLIGEDVEIGLQGTTKGLREEFGPERVRNCPISEAAFTGVGVGAAAIGSRPIIDLMYGTFNYVAMDQLANQAAKLRYMTGGQVRLPITYLMVSGAGHMGAAQHSESPHGMFMNVPGLKIAMPSGPREAKGLVKAAVRDDNPTLVFFDFTLLRGRAEVSDDPTFTLPLGVAEVKREGKDVTIVGIGPAVPRALAAAQGLAAKGIDAEVVDVLSLAPLDGERILASVAKTGRLVVVDDAPPRAGAASEIVALAAEEGFAALKAPVHRVCRLPVPMPFNRNLERYVIPDTARIEAAAIAAVEGK